MYHDAYRASHTVLRIRTSHHEAGSLAQTESIRSRCLVYFSGTITIALLQPASSSTVTNNIKCFSPQRSTPVLVKDRNFLTTYVRSNLHYRYPFQEAKAKPMSWCCVDQSSILVIH